MTSQIQAARLLMEVGYPVTQATVSRDLTAIGAVKRRHEDGSIYGIGRGDTSELSPTMDQFVLDVIPSGNLVILRTPPGAANLVASALDGAGLAEIAGTVAGDDTVLVVATPGSSGKRIAGVLIGGST